MISSHIAGAALALALAAPAAWMTFDREPPLAIEDARVVTPVVAPGGTLRVRYVLDRRRVCRTRVERAIFDGAGVEYRFAADERPAFGPRGRQAKTLELTVPAGGTKVG